MHGMVMLQLSLRIKHSRENDLHMFLILIGLIDQYSKGHFSWNLVSARNNKIKDEKCWSCENVARE